MALSVLVVEDNTVIGALLAETLAALGHNVCAIAATEAEAVSAAARCRPDLMIVDVNLASGNGIAAVETIVRARATPHVLVCCDTSGVLAWRPGAIALQKPYREYDLVRAMERALLAPQSA
jgi:CheY-like chemotaxis protein